MIPTSLKWMIFVTQMTNSWGDYIKPSKNNSVDSVSIDIDECFFFYFYKQYTINEKFISILTLLADVYF